MMIGRVVKIYYSLVAPRSRAIDVARREYILNILLLGSIVLSFIATISSSFSFAIAEQRSDYLGTYLLVWLILLLFVFGYFLSRRGKVRPAAFILIVLYYLAATLAALEWGVEIPNSILIFALLIVLSGILISSKAAVIIAAFISATIISIILLHSSHIVTANLQWRSNLPFVRDGIVYSSILFIIALVSWLFNREMERALQRARISELALKKQNDQLEIIVAERTQELKRVQVEKLLQLYRFAEFGKLSSGLFHELVTPLNIISLNLKQARKDTIHTQLQEKLDRSLERAMLGTERLEKYLKAARKQIQSQDISQEFSLNEEIKSAIQMLEYKARQEKTKIVFTANKKVMLFGNPLKLNQLIINLVINGIDAYDMLDRKDKRVEIVLKKVKNNVVISVQDWGSGIDEKILPKIFDPLFTTKSFDKGTGIGLSLCKEIVEKYFKGRIEVTSKKGFGTTFTLAFAITKTPVYQLKKESKK